MVARHTVTAAGRWLRAKWVDLPIDAALGSA
jgi:hypothetical protein